MMVQASEFPFVVIEVPKTSYHCQTKTLMRVVSQEYCMAVLLVFMSPAENTYPFSTLSNYQWRVTTLRNHLRTTHTTQSYNLNIPPSMHCWRDF
jgi:hypothetical protein